MQRTVLQKATRLVHAKLICVPQIIEDPRIQNTWQIVMNVLERLQTFSLFLLNQLKYRMKELLCPVIFTVQVIIIMAKADILPGQP